MTKLLITGGSGQLAKCFQAMAGNFPQYHVKFPSKNEVDICKIETLETFVKTHQINTIINTAAFTNVEVAEDEEEQAHNVNVQGVENCVRVAEKHSLKLIHFSTDYVFDGIQKEYSEEDTCSPINAYGKTKMEGEKIIRASYIDAIVIRTSWLFSPFGNNFVKTIMRLMQKKETVEVVNDQWGRPTYGIHLAQTVFQMLSVSTIFNHKIYHFANAEEATWFEMAQEIGRHSSFNGALVPISSEAFPTKAKRPKSSILSTHRIEKTLGIEIPSWKIGLKQCLEKIESYESI